MRTNSFTLAVIAFLLVVHCSTMKVNDPILSRYNLPLLHGLSKRANAAKRLPKHQHSMESEEKRGSSYNGKATWYGAGAGACGGSYTSRQYIGALSTPKFQDGKHCGKQVRVWDRNDPSHSVTIEIVDECPGCAPTQLDLSKAAFSKLAPLSQGVVKVDWEYL